MNTIHSQISTLNSPLPPGYKQTEVGVIPDEWDAVPLKGKVSITHGFAFASQHFAAHGFSATMSFNRATSLWR